MNYPSVLLPIFRRYPDFYANRKDAIEARLREIQYFDSAMLAAAIEQGLSKIGQKCRYLSWERLDKSALIACARGLGATAIANFCRVVSRGARRAGLPDLMLWRQVDGIIVRQFVNGSHTCCSRSILSSSSGSQRASRLCSRRTAVCCTSNAPNIALPATQQRSPPPQLLDARAAALWCRC